MNSLKKSFSLLLNSNITKTIVMTYCFFSVYCPPFAKIIFKSNILQLIRICGFALIFVLYFIKFIKQKKISILIISSSIFALYILFMSYINHSATPIIYLYQVINILCAVVINDIFSENDDKKLFYVVILFMLSSYLFAEIFLFIKNLFTSDISYGYIIYSNRNVIFIYLIPLFLLYNFFVNSKYKYYYLFVIFMSILFNIISGALTTSIVFIIIVVYNLILSKSKNIKRIQTSYVLMLFIVFSIFFTLVYFGTDSIFVKTAEKLSSFIPKLQSLYDRAEIYDNVRLYSNVHPFFGYGYKYYYDGVEVYNRNFVLTHNTIFDILIYGGVVALCMFLIIQYVMVVNGKNDKKYQAFVIISLLCMSIRDMFESTSLYFIFFNYGLLYYYISNYKCIYLNDIFRFYKK